MNTRTEAQATCLDSVDQLKLLGITPQTAPERVEPMNVLMCPPEHFEVKDCKNPFMKPGQCNVDAGAARRQWDALKHTYERLGYGTGTLAPQPGLEDMVFTANQVLVGRRSDGTNVAIMSEMKHEARRGEVPHFAQWFKSRGYEIVWLNGNGPSESAPRFEGHGDGIWHPGRQWLWGGHGFRSEPQAYDAISTILGVPVARLHLVDPTFYHLDTCFCVLDERSVMLYPPAFARDSLELVYAGFSRVFEVSEREAFNFACNALTIGRTVVIQSGSPDICRQLNDAGFQLVEVDTSEFMKSGGSVFCLKALYY